VCLVLREIQDTLEQLGQWDSKAHEDHLVKEVLLDHQVQAVVKAPTVHKVLKDHQDHVVLPAQLVQWVRQDLRAQQDHSANQAKLVLPAAVDQRESKDGKDLLEVAVMQVIKVRLGREEGLEDLDKEVLVVLLVLRVDLDIQELREIEDSLDCKDLKEHLDQQVCISVLTSTRLP